MSPMVGRIQSPDLRGPCRAAYNSKEGENMKNVMRFIRDEEGLTTVEYAIAKRESECLTAEIREAVPLPARP